MIQLYVFKDYHQWEKNWSKTNYTKEQIADNQVRIAVGYLKVCLLSY